ncbi:MAG: Helicase associated domain protein, partial [bacterium]|nr:Helicase associated domain protein [bacterium]
MLEQIFDINTFNIYSDEENYYFFRALNNADHNDIKTGITSDEKGDILRVRTDFERYKDTPTYSYDDDLSLKQILDHIKEHHRTDTNCISVTSNANAAITYGRKFYHDEYVIVKVPKKELGKRVYNAGLYMLEEINKRINEIIKNDPSIDYSKKTILDFVDSIQTKEQLEKIKSTILTKEDDSLSLFQDGLIKNFTTSLNYLSLNEEQNLQKDKVILKLDLINRQILPKTSNKLLIQTIGLAFSSLELIHYKDITKEEIIAVPREFVDILAILQQMPKNLQFIDEIKNIVIDKIQNIKLNGEYNYDDFNVTIKDLTMDSMYDITEGRVSYKKALDLYKKAFYIAKSRIRAINSANILRKILNNDKYEDTIKYIEKNGYGIETEITTRASKDLLQVSESISLEISNEEKILVDYLTKLDINTLYYIMKNPKATIKYLINEFLDTKVDTVSMQEEDFIANALVDSIDLSRFNIKASLNDSQRKDILEALKSHKFLEVYYNLKDLGVSEKDITNVLFTNIIKNKNDINLKDTFTKEELEYFVGYNRIKNTKLELYPHQREAVENIDDIFKTKNFTSAIMATGSGKSFVALYEMLKFQKLIKEKGRDAKILYLAPNDTILYQLKGYIKEFFNPEQHIGDSLDKVIHRLFPGLVLSTYQNLKDVNRLPKDIKAMFKENFDFIVFDELHRTGAIEWKEYVEKLLKYQNDNTKILGITATPERDVDLRDMADHWAQVFGYTDEEIILEKHIAKKLDLVDAIKSRKVVNPRVVNCMYSLITDGTMDEMKFSIDSIKDENLKKEELKKYEELRREVENSSGIEKIIGENLKSDGKYIVFLPITKKNDGTYEDEDGNQVDKSTAERVVKDYQALFNQYLFSYEYLNDSKNHIRYIYNKITNNEELTTDDKKYLLSEKENILLLAKINIPNKPSALNTETNIIADTIINKMGWITLTKEDQTHNLNLKMKNSVENYSILGSYGKKNEGIIEKFRNSKTPKLKLMFAMNVLNEGTHVGDVNGIIWLRPLDANSKILYLQQLGRCIRAIKPGEVIKDEDLPLVLDLVNNTLKVKLDKGEIKESVDLNNLIEASYWIENNNRYPNIDSDDSNEKLILKTLIKIKSKYLKYLLDEDLLKQKNVNTKLIIQEIIKVATNIDLWNTDIPSIEQKEVQKKLKLEDKNDSLINYFNITGISRRFLELSEEVEKYDNSWDQYYNLAQNYYNYYHNLSIPYSFTTKDGVTKSKEKSIARLGKWVSRQRQDKKNKKLSEEKIKRLESIGMIWDSLEDKWEQNYSLAQRYYNHYHNLKVPQNFTTKDGITETQDKGALNLGVWISTQRENRKNGILSKYRTKRLELIGMIWDSLEDKWEQNYSLAQRYYNHYHNLKIPGKFMTKDGVTETEEKGSLKLGKWILTQRENRKNGTLSKYRTKRLELIGMIWDSLEDKWEQNYSLAQRYYNHYHNLKIPGNFTTNDGITETQDKGALNLGNWISTQRKNKKLEILSEDRIKRLELIGMLWDSLEETWEQNYSLAQRYYNYYHNLKIPGKFMTKDGVTETEEKGVLNLGSWLSTQKYSKKNGTLSEDRIKKLESIGIVWNSYEDKWEQNYSLAQRYYNHY